MTVSYTVVLHYVAVQVEHDLCLTGLSVIKLTVTEKVHKNEII